MTMKTATMRTASSHAQELDPRAWATLLVRRPLDAKLGQEHLEHLAAEPVEMLTNCHVIETMLAPHAAAPPCSHRHPWCAIGCHQTTEQLEACLMQLLLKPRACHHSHPCPRSTARQRHHQRGQLRPHGGLAEPDVRVAPDQSAHVPACDQPPPPKLPQPVRRSWRLPRLLEATGLRVVQLTEVDLADRSGTTIDHMQRHLGARCRLGGHVRPRRHLGHLGRICHRRRLCLSCPTLDRLGRTLGPRRCFHLWP